MIFPGKFVAASVLSVAILPLPLLPAAAADDLAWPPITAQARPWTWWWWHGSAVNETNLVDVNYRPFNAADWPLTDCGLLGPVTLTPVTAE